MSTTLPPPGSDKSEGDNVQPPYEYVHALAHWSEAQVRLASEGGVTYLHLMVQLAGGRTAIVPLPWEMGIERLAAAPTEAFRIVWTDDPAHPYAMQWLTNPLPLADVLPAAHVPPVRLPHGSGTTKPQEPLSGGTPLPDFMWQNEHLMKQVGDL
jgi:hypothetical protein